MPLTEKQEGVANHLDELGLGLIAAPVVGDIMGRTIAHRGGMLGAIGQAGQHFHEHYGPYSDLTGLGLLMPTVMHGVAKKVAPDEGAAAPEMAPSAPPASPLQKAAFAAGQRAALRKLGMEDQMSEHGYTMDEAREMASRGPREDLHEVQSGLNEELEHRNITHGNDALTKKIVDAHLSEDPHYYSKLKAALG